MLLRHNDDRKRQFKHRKKVTVPTLTHFYITAKRLKGCNVRSKCEWLNSYDYKSIIGEKNMINLETQVIVCLTGKTCTVYCSQVTISIPCAIIL